MGYTALVTFANTYVMGLIVDRVQASPDAHLVDVRDLDGLAYVSAFGFKGSDQQKPSNVLSGGERNRLNLALTLKEGGNLLLLDELAAKVRKDYEELKAMGLQLDLTRGKPAKAHLSLSKMVKLCLY